MPWAQSSPDARAGTGRHGGWTHGTWHHGLAGGQAGPWRSCGPCPGGPPTPCVSLATPPRGRQAASRRHAAARACHAADACARHLASPARHVHIGRGPRSHWQARRIADPCPFLVVLVIRCKIAPIEEPGPSWAPVGSGPSFWQLRRPAPPPNRQCHVPRGLAGHARAASPQPTAACPARLRKLGTVAGVQQRLQLSRLAANA